MTPIRAIIVGPLRATSIKTSIAACHSGRSGSFFGQAGDVVGGVSQRDELSLAWQRYRILELALPVSHPAIRVAC